MLKIKDLPKQIVADFRKGIAIPAMPLPLNEDRTYNKQYQKAIIKYYIDSGAKGLAVGVHSTQFEIRDKGIDLFEPVLKFASDTIDEYCKEKNVDFLKIGGVCGKTEQGKKEAEYLVSQGYHAALVSMKAMDDESIDAVLEHCREIAKVMPIIGFYLQTAVGGRVFPFEFWKEFAKIDNVLGIKMAPFNRYHTFDVVRAVCEAGKENEVTLYTGNDDNIIVDLLSEYNIRTKDGEKRVRIKGGLLGHFCVWTQKAVEYLDEIHDIIDNNKDVPMELLTKGIEVTDANAVFFDTANNFEGLIPGINEVLTRQGLMLGNWCLNKKEVLSKGQAEDLDRVNKAYPHLNDDAFIKANLEKWLS